MGTSKYSLSISAQVVSEIIHSLNLICGLEIGFLVKAKKSFPLLALAFSKIWFGNAKDDISHVLYLKRRTVESQNRQT